MEATIRRENLIRSLIGLKHKSQDIINNKLSFLPIKDVFLLSPIDLKNFNTVYQETFIAIKTYSDTNNLLSKELKKFPLLNTQKYESSLIQRTLLLIAAWLFFFPLGIYIYYVVLSRRGKLKFQLTQIISTCHALIHSINQQHHI